jgi:hypothetical protein
VLYASVITRIRTHLDGTAGGGTPGGFDPLSQPTVLAILRPLYLLLYGAGALLIRELVRRSGRGWVSILLLGAAYGFIEEGFATQSLFHPTLYHAADWGACILGINGVFTTSVIVIHAVWSAAIPILLTELLFPGRRSTPYLGRGGLVGTSICYVLGVALLWFVAQVVLQKSERNARNVTSHFPVQLRQPPQTDW